MDLFRIIVFVHFMSLYLLTLSINYIVDTYTTNHMRGLHPRNPFLMQSTDADLTMEGVHGYRRTVIRY